MNLLDERTLRSFEVPAPAIEEAIRFGDIFGHEASGLPESVQCKAFPPDGVKVVLSCEDRALTLYFFGDGRFVFGKAQAQKPGSQGEGELSLNDGHREPRVELFRWLLENC